MSLGDRAARGVVWLVGQTLATKVLVLIAQLVLAKIIAKQDFGYVGLAYTVAAFAGFIQSGGWDTILVQRQARFRRWANAIFWMSLTGGLLTSAVMLLAAPVAAWLWKGPVFGLIALLALRPPFDGLAIVPSARLQIELRFRTIALVATGTSLATAALSVIFAWLEFGAYSFVLPLPIVAAARSAALWLLAAPPLLRGDPQVRRWRLLIGHAGVMTAIAFFGLLVSQGAYLVLGIFHQEAVVGTYFFAFNLSTQIVTLLTQSLFIALFPALTQLADETRRQTQAFIRATTMLGLVAVPLCLLQAALARPVLHLLYGPKWLDAVPVLQVLSIGMVFSVMGSPSASLILAQGRFRMFFWWSAAISLVFLAAVTTGAALGGAVAVAVAVTAFLTLATPVGFYLAAAPGGVSWGQVARVFVTPLVSGGAALGGAAILARLLPVLTRHDALYIAWVTGLGCVSYILLARLLAPADVRELGARVGGLIRRHF